MFVVILSVQVKVHGDTEISYENNGTIKICNESNTSFGELSIEIYSDDTLIKQKISIKKNYSMQKRIKILRIPMVMGKYFRKH